MSSFDYVYIFGPLEYSIDDAQWIGDGDYGILVKVGKTGDPKSALASLRRARPEYDFWSVRYIKNFGTQFEKGLHELWRPYRRDGEFFALPQADLEWFEKIDLRDVYSCRFCRYFGLWEQREQWMKSMREREATWNKVRPVYGTPST